MNDPIYLGMRVNDIIYCIDSEDAEKKQRMLLTKGIDTIIEYDDGDVYLVVRRVKQ